MSDIKKQKILNCNITRISPYPTRISDVGVKLDLGIHDVDLVRFITGQNIDIWATTKSNNVSHLEDTASFFFDLSGGSTGMIFNSWMSPFRKRTIRLMTPSAYYDIDMLRQQAVKHTAIDNNSYAAKSLFVNRKNALEEQAKAFIKYIKTGKMGHLCSVEDALEALKYVEEKV